MSKNHNNHNGRPEKQNEAAGKVEQEVKQQTEINDVTDDADAESLETAEEAQNADLQNQLDAARAEIEKDRNDYLLLMAEFDNYRKRVTREKADLLKNAAERVLLGLLPIVDDFERGIAAIGDNPENNGVKAMDSTGNDFDPELHEAIATIPAPAPELKGKVIDTTTKGYMLNDKVLRHAKVAVGE